MVEIVEALPNSRAANHLGNQLLRSGTSPALNYGEAQSGESRSDFIHKIKIVLKELRETFNCLRIIERTRLYPPGERMAKAIQENNELISIFVKTCATALRNLKSIDEPGSTRIIKS
jgi:four helix bundle protein